jgi:hypothetical protein
MSRKVIGRVEGVCARTKVQAGTAISATTMAARRAAKSETFMEASKVRRCNRASRMRCDYTSGPLPQKAYFTRAASVFCSQLTMTVAGGVVRSTNRLIMNRPSGARGVILKFSARKPCREECVAVPSQESPTSIGTAVICPGGCEVAPSRDQTGKRPASVETGRRCGPRAVHVDVHLA